MSQTNCLIPRLHTKNLELDREHGHVCKLHPPQTVGVKFLLFLLCCKASHCLVALTVKDVKSH